MSLTVANTMKPNIGISDSHCESVVLLLNTLLADEHVLYTKTRNYHWNVTGPHFQELHKMFEGQYDQLEGSIDEIAERIRSVGGRPAGTMTEFVRLARLREQPGQYPSAREMVASLLQDHEAVIRSLRADLERCAEEYHDMGTSDFLTGLMEDHEKIAWMLRAWLED